jgi:hypothetical protein
MPIPTAADHSLGEIDSLHNMVLVRLRTLHYSKTRDPRNAIDALREYRDKVMDFIDAEQG